MCRKNSKPVILNLCKDTISCKESQNSNHLGTISFLFNKLNDVYRESLQLSNDTGSNKKDFIQVEKKPFTVIDQNDIFSIVFSIFETKSEVSKIFINLYYIHSFKFLNLLEH